MPVIFPMFSQVLGNLLKQVMTLAYLPWGETLGPCRQTLKNRRVARLASDLEQPLSIVPHTDLPCLRISHSTEVAWRSKGLKANKSLAYLTWVIMAFRTMVFHGIEATLPCGPAATSAITTLTVCLALRLALQTSSFLGRVPDIPTTGWTSWMPVTLTVAWCPIARQWPRSGTWVTPLWTVMDGPYTHQGLQLRVRLWVQRQMLSMPCSVRYQTGLEQELYLSRPHSAHKRYPGHRHLTCPQSGAADTLVQPPLQSPSLLHLGLLSSPIQHSRNRTKIHCQHLILSSEAASGIRLVRHLLGPPPQNK